MSADDTPRVTPQAWVAALESGDYVHGTGAMVECETDDDDDVIEDTARHCCLGVLASLLGDTIDELLARGTSRPDGRSYPDWFVDAPLQGGWYARYRDALLNEGIWTPEDTIHEYDLENPYHREQFEELVRDKLAMENDNGIGYPIELIKEMFL